MHIRNALPKRSDASKDERTTEINQHHTKLESGVSIHGTTSRAKIGMGVHAQGCACGTGLWRRKYIKRGLAWLGHPGTALEGAWRMHEFRQMRDATQGEEECRVGI